MKTKIDYILQIKGQNLLQVHYKSGFDRFIRPNSWGTYESNMTKSQLDYMGLSKCYEMFNADGWGNSIYYFLLNDSPLINYIENRNSHEINRRFAK